MNTQSIAKENKVIAIDFDGTICTNKYPFIGYPNWDVIKQAMYEKEFLGACLVLWTCRTGIELDEAVNACAEWGLEIDYVNENPPSRIAMYHGEDPRKISADEYWDDKAVVVTKTGKVLGR